jgi:hypothetical protein
MRALFITSLLCGIMSLLALVAVSAMTVVPSPGAEHSRSILMTIAGVFVLGWFGLSIWVRRRTSGVSQPLPPLWLTHSLICVGLVYLCAIIVFVVG